jgi:hypothetical protein
MSRALSLSGNRRLITSLGTPTRSSPLNWVWVFLLFILSLSQSNAESASPRTYSQQRLKIATSQNSEGFTPKDREINILKSHLSELRGPLNGVVRYNLLPFESNLLKNMGEAYWYDHNLGDSAKSIFEEGEPKEIVLSWIIEILSKSTQNTVRQVVHAGMFMVVILGRGKVGPRQIRTLASDWLGLLTTYPASPQVNSTVMSLRADLEVAKTQMSQPTFRIPGFNWEVGSISPGDLSMVFLEDWAEQYSACMKNAEEIVKQVGVVHDTILDIIVEQTMLFRYLVVDSVFQVGKLATDLATLTRINELVDQVDATKNAKIPFKKNLVQYGPMGGGFTWHYLIPLIRWFGHYIYNCRCRIRKGVSDLTRPLENKQEESTEQIRQKGLLRGCLGNTRSWVRICFMVTLGILSVNTFQQPVIKGMTDVTMEITWVEMQLFQGRFQSGTPQAKIESCVDETKITDMDTVRDEILRCLEAVAATGEFDPVDMVMATYDTLEIFSFGFLRGDRNILDGVDVSARLNNHNELKEKLMARPSDKMTYRTQERHRYPAGCKKGFAKIQKEVEKLMVSSDQARNLSFVNGIAGTLVSILTLLGCGMSLATRAMLETLARKLGYGTCTGRFIEVLWYIVSIALWGIPRCLCKCGSRRLKNKEKKKSE